MMRLRFVDFRFADCRFSIGTNMVVLVLALPLCAHAETALEKEVGQAAMPHVGKKGNELAVHWVSLQGYVEGKPGNAERLAALKTDVAKCVANNQTDHRPAHPPTQWPDHLEGLREDTYLAKNVSITYGSGWVYSINALDCSLLSTRRDSASLKSAAGLCQIDFNAKTAKGYCDWDAHRNARSIAHPHDKGAGTAAMLAKLKSNPAISASAIAQMEANLKKMAPAASGPGKNILGISCQVETVLNSEVCVASGGSFAPSQKMVLERFSEHGIRMTAKQTALDQKVAQSVFVPYLAGGFKIEGKAEGSAGK